LQRTSVNQAFIEVFFFLSSKVGHIWTQIVPDIKLFLTMPA